MAAFCWQDGLRLVSTGNRLRVAAVGVLLAVQCGVGVWQHLGSTRYFAWAPNDYLMTYSLGASVRGHALTPEQMSERYRLSLAALVSARAQRDIGLASGMQYVWEDPPAEVKRRIRRVEATYPPTERAQVRLDYQLDAGPVQHWRWPQ
jgi:hypothetical protein